MKDNSTFVTGMNARMYDPVLGRFLSPDNYVQSPNCSQSYNRYSYAFNNPLIYTDSTGQSMLKYPRDGDSYYYRGEYYYYDSGAGFGIGGYVKPGGGFISSAGGGGSINGYQLTGSYTETTNWGYNYFRKDEGNFDKYFFWSSTVISDIKYEWTYVGNYSNPNTEQVSSGLYPTGGGGGAPPNDRYFRPEYDKPPLISGMYKTSWDNLGYHIRNADSWWQQNGYKYVGPIVEIHPLISGAEGINMLFVGTDIYGKPSSNLQGVWKIGSSISSFLKGPTVPSIIIDNIINEAAKPKQKNR